MPCRKVTIFHINFRYVDEAGIIHERIWEKVRFGNAKSLVFNENKHFHELTFDTKGLPVRRKIVGPLKVLGDVLVEEITKNEKNPHLSSGSSLNMHGKQKYRKIQGRLVNPLHLLTGLNTTELYSTEVGKKLEYLEVTTFQTKK